jgi:hypothetical protein
MKRHLLIALLFLSLSKLSHAQNEYYDALKLKSLLDSSGKQFNTDSDSLKKAAIILYNYLKSTSQTPASLTYQDIQAKLSTGTSVNYNPILSPYLPNLGSASPAPLDASGSGAFHNLIGTGVQAVGGLDVTNIATGVADLLIDRAKQELTVAFFDKFKKFSTDNPEFQILFPATTSNLNNLLSYSFPQMLPALRTGFLDDISKITYNLDDVLSLPRYQTLLQNFPEIRVAIKSLRLVHEIETGASNAADILNEFASFSEWKDSKLTRIGSYLAIARLFSESIRNDTTRSHSNSVWIDANKLKALFYDPALFNLYLGLLYQQSIKDSIVLIDGQGGITKFTEILYKQENNVFVFQNMLKKFFDLTGNVNAVYTGIQSKIKARQSPADDDYYNYINVSIDVIDYGFTIAKTFDNKPVPDDYLAVLRQSNNLYKDIYTKKYAQAITDALGVFTQLDAIANKSIDVSAIKKAIAANASYDTSVKAEITQLAAADLKWKTADNAGIDDLIKSGITDTAVVQLLEYYNLQRLLDFIEKVKPYALFMANVIEAKSAADVTSALDNAILPVGSYSIKQTADCNISLNGYVGYGLDINYANGIYAPVGFSFSHSFGGFFTPTIFFSVIDVGSVVSYQLSNPTTNAATSSGATMPVNTATMSQQIKLGSLFSPSAQIFFGIRKTPIAIGAGWRRTPTLFYSNSTTYSTIGAKSVFNVAALIDIPFFTLHNTPLKQ